MTLPEELLNDISLFLIRVDELTHSDRKDLLLTMLKKHLLLDKSELILSKYDYDMMISKAKTDFSENAVPTSISGKSIDHKDSINVLLIESVINVLNSKGALKRLPKFDRR
jgi:hypothetical protein